MNKIIIALVAVFFVPVASLAQNTMKVTTGTTLSVEAGVGMFVQGGLSLDDNSQFKNNGTVTLSRGLSLTADFLDASVASYNYGNGQFVFAGQGTQNVSTINTFGSVLVSNGGLTLSTDVSANSWILQKGIITTGSHNLIVRSTSSLSLDADAANPDFSVAWINGNIRRYIAPQSVDSYRFPVGNGAHPSTITIANLSAVPLMGVNYLNAFFGPKHGTDAGLNVSEMATSYASVNSGGVWHLVPDAGPTSGRFTLQLGTNGFIGLTDNSFAILARPSGSNTGEQWKVPQGSTLPVNGAPGRTTASGFAQRNGMTAFGEFGIGVALTVLPLQLVAFNATKHEQSVLLDWTTTQEENTNRFEVYRSDGQGQMVLIGSVQAAGFSSTAKKYSFTDEDPLTGINFYQLKSIDTDGRFTLSKTLMVKFDSDQTLNVYPNPVISQTFTIEHSAAEIKNIQLITMDGKKVGINRQPISNTQIRITLAGSVASGNYILQMTTASGTHSRLITIR